MTSFFRFPHTPHVAWLGAGKPRDDKVLTAAEASGLLADEILVEEKVDGANLGFSVDEHGRLRAQSRGSYIDLDPSKGQWKPLKRWLAPLQHVLVQALGPDLMLFGEWCYAVHSVRYTRLPDWFLSFDVYDRRRREFWSVDRRDAFAAGLGIATVPRLDRRRYDLASLMRLLDASRLTDGPAEGLYLRREVEDRLIARAKLVRAEFVQAIGEHWTKRALEPNRLDIAPRDPRS